MHFHVHVKDAPKLDKNTDDEIIRFVDKHISCSLPDESEDKDLHELVTSLQSHRHSQTCKKKSTACIFFFPRPISPKTLIARPPDSDTDQVKLTSMKNIYKQCMIL